MVNFKNKNSQAESKVNELILVLREYFSESSNLARIKFFGLFLCALCKVRTVGFERLSVAFDSQAKSDSSLRRIQRFIAGFNLNLDLISKIIFSRLTHSPPFRLALDRTNWKFGSFDLNALVLAIGYKGIIQELFFVNMLFAFSIPLLRYFPKIGPKTAPATTGITKT